MAYVPPHKRVPVAPPAAEQNPIKSTQTHLEWLREQQSKTIVTIKTPQQLRAELEALSFKELCARAGPGPAIDGFDFYSSDCNDAELGGKAFAERSSFSSTLASYRRGLNPPPAPLSYEVTLADWDDEKGGDAKKCATYSAWYNQWGKLLTNKYRQENKPLTTPTATRVVTPPRRTTTEPLNNLTRPIEVSAQSGW